MVSLRIKRFIYEYAVPVFVVLVAHPYMAKPAFYAGMRRGEMRIVAKKCREEIAQRQEKTAREKAVQEKVA